MSVERTGDESARFDLEQALAEAEAVLMGHDRPWNRGHSRTRPTLLPLGPFDDDDGGAGGGREPRRPIRPKPQAAGGPPEEERAHPPGRTSPYHPPSGTLRPQL